MLANWAGRRLYEVARTANRPGWSVDPGDWHAYGRAPSVPPRWTPAPIVCPLHKTRLHRIGVYVVELLEQLVLTIDVVNIRLGLPEPLARPKSCKVAGGVRSVVLKHLFKAQRVFGRG